MNTVAKLWNGRQVKEEIIFEDEGFLFGGWNKASQWLYKNGYRTGSMDANKPIGIMKTKYTVQWKWGRMAQSDKDKLDGVIISEDFNYKPAKVILFESKNI